MDAEPEFSATDVAELLAAVPSPQIVVVGGQAVNALAERYIGRDDALAAEAPFTSKDLDVFANRGEMLRWERELGGRATVQLPSPDHMGCVQGGILRYRLDDGRKLKVDFMTAVYGLKDREVASSAISAELDAHEPVRVAILSPVLCVKSRVANVVGLPSQYDNEHGLKQLRASIVACRHFLEELAREHPDPRAILDYVEALFHVSCERRAVRLYRQKAIDTFTALPSLDLLPPAFRERRHPQMLQILAAKRRSHRP